MRIRAPMMRIHTVAAGGGLDPAFGRRPLSAPPVPTVPGANPRPPPATVATAR